MEGSRASEWFELRSVAANNLESDAIVSCAFDPGQQLLWTGSSSGRIQGFLNPNLEPYCTFQGHNDECRQLTVCGDAVLSLSHASLKVHSRGGFPRLAYTEEGDPTTFDWRCMDYSFQTAHVTVGGAQPVLKSVDLAAGGVVVVETKLEGGGANYLKGSRMLMCAEDTGVVTFRDPHSLAVQHSLECFTGAANVVDVKGDLLVTIGASDINGELFLDPYVKVFDIRRLGYGNAPRPLNQIAFQPGPSMVKFHPNFSSTVLVGSMFGQFQLCDVEGGFFSSRLFQVETEESTSCLDISSSGEILCFGDDSGFLHQWGDREDIKVNIYSEPTDIPDLFPEYEPLEWDKPFTDAPMPITDEPLLSDWDLSVPFFVANPPIVVPESLTAQAKFSDFIQIVPNPGVKKGMESYITDSTLQQLVMVNGGGKLSTAAAPFRSRAQHAGEALAMRPKLKFRFPRVLQLVTVAPQKMDMDDFDPSIYNKTKLSGLENSLPNSYCNALLQSLFYTPAVHSHLVSHSCDVEPCLSCELAFLFHMLDSARGRPCHAGNFLRAFRQLPEAAALGLLETVEQTVRDATLVKRVQSLNRFVLEKLHQEALLIEGRSGAADSFLENFFGFAQRKSSLCLSCKHEATRVSNVFQTRLAYPRKDEGKEVTFASLLSAGLCNAHTSRVWCDGCRSYQVVKQEHKLTSLPLMLTVGCGDGNPEEVRHWQWKHNGAYEEFFLPPNNAGANEFASPTPEKGAFHRENSKSSSVGSPAPSQLVYQPFLPLKLQVLVGEDGVIVDSEDDSPIAGAVEYELHAVISYVEDKSKDAANGHLVTHVKVPSSLRSRSDSLSNITPTKSAMGISDWFLFNDISVSPSKVEDVLHFHSDWKLPCVVFYMRTDAAIAPPAAPSLSLQAGMAAFNEYSLSSASEPLQTFVPPSPQELCSPSLAAIDAEFVALTAEETERRSDGSSYVVKPSRMAVGRVSVVRAVTFDATRAEGVPLIDDYILAQEPVVDYLTRFSGLMNGDLDQATSRHHLTTLKSAYIKLRQMIDRGWTFVGHGLKNDFRILNVYVPPERVIDTVNLFHLKRQRKIGLRFLAAVLLKLDIQSETHCSIEDARTALALYRKHEELVQSGQKDIVLHEIYAVGHRVNWQLPLPPDFSLSVDRH